MWKNFTWYLVVIGLVALAFVRIKANKRERLKFLKFVQKFPNMHPREFFDRKPTLFGITRQTLPEKPSSTIDLTRIDFRNKDTRKSIGIFSLARGVIDTITIVRLILLAQKKDSANLNSIASALAIIWATRVAWLSRAAVSVEGLENLPVLGGRRIFLFTHASFLDFALAPLVTNRLPIFLLAKDHFRDNFIFRHLIGIGRAAETLGMIFVDRKAKDKKAAAKQVTLDAARCLINDGGPLAIFPQGSRAFPFLGGERLGAGYYTVGHRDRIKTHGAHLKKGAAHIALAVPDVVLVPVGIQGAAIACPKGSLSIRPNTEIKFHIGKPIFVREGDDVDSLHLKIDNALKGEMGIHAELERHFLEDIRKMLDSMRLDEVAIAMKSWRGEDYLYYAILDAIYASHPRLQREFLGELIHLILDFAPRDDFLRLKAKIAASLPN